MWSIVHNIGCKPTAGLTTGNGDECRCPIIGPPPPEKSPLGGSVPGKSLPGGDICRAKVSPGGTKSPMGELYIRPRHYRFAPAIIDSQSTWRSLPFHVMQYTVDVTVAVFLVCFYLLPFSLYGCYLINTCCYCYICKALSTLPTIVAEFGDCHRKRRLSPSCQCGQGLSRSALRGWCRMSIVVWRELVMNRLS